MFIRVIKTATLKMSNSPTDSDLTRAQPVREENGTAKSIIVRIYPPFAIPNIYPAAAGNIENVAPSVIKARATQIEHGIT